jgi:hypothetical protein
MSVGDNVRIGLRTVSRGGQLRSRVTLPSARVYFVDSSNSGEHCFTLPGPETGVSVVKSTPRILMSDPHQNRAGTAATERYETLFRVSPTLISIRSSEELFRLLARELRAVVNFYVMGVGIYDERAHEVRLTSYGEPGVPSRFQNLRQKIRSHGGCDIGSRTPMIPFRFCYGWLP